MAGREGSSLRATAATRNGISTAARAEAEEEEGMPAAGVMARTVRWLLGPDLPTVCAQG